MSQNILHVGENQIVSQNILHVGENQHFMPFSLCFHCSLMGFRGREVYEPPRYMTVSQAATQLMQAMANRERDDHPLKCKINAVQ